MSLKTLPSRWWTGDHLAVIGESRAAITTAAGVVLEESNACRCSLLLMSTRRQTGCTYTLHCSGIKYWCTHFLNASPGSAVPPPPPRNSRWREASDFRICSLRLLCTDHEKSLCIMWWVCIVCQLVCVFEDKVNIIILKDRSFLRRMCV